MSVELRPLGVKCNIQCLYCYQNPQRDAGNVAHRYDLARMQEAVEEEGGGFTLFGGEALLVPLEDLEALWKWGYETYGHNGVQTNGTLLRDEHIELFKKYNVQVGVSIDGPGELNDIRWVGTLARTRAATAKTEAAIERLCEEGIPPSLIITLHRGNAAPDRLPVLHEWMWKLEALGIRSVRLHILEVDNPLIQQKYALSTEENAAAFLSFLELEKRLKTLRFDVFDDMRLILRGRDDQATCIWRACDPYTTKAVRGVEGFGQRSNCGRTNKDGIDFVKSDTEGFERYLALYHTPVAYGGCQGCRFFLMCKGQCPGTALGGDWRNRTEHCQVWYELLERLEADLIEEGEVPLSTWSRRAFVEAALVAEWAAGRNVPISHVLKALNGEEARAEDAPPRYQHVDHFDAARSRPVPAAPALVE